MLFISTFAFLLASFPARNSDVWMHLAAGRSVTQGRLSLDNSAVAEPGSGSTWLYDLVSYGVYSLAGGAGLVVGKALVVVGIGIVMLRLSRTRPGWWLPAVCTAMALLAMGTRLLLLPETVSYLFLALALLFLTRREENAQGRPVPLLPPWPLAILFAVWANVDAGFVIGLGTVALIWLGQTLDESVGRPRNLLRRTIALVVLGAVCLLNPSHIHAYSWPVELAWSGTSAGSAATELGQVTSPFGRPYLTRFGQSPAGLAYYPLLGLGLLSFALTARRWRWQRFLPWLGLAVLSTVQARAIPYFAVLGGPVLAWNLQDFYAGYVAAGRVGPRRSGVRRPTAAVSAAVLGLALLACAWPGWLQFPPFEPRRWAVETPPALERSALATHRWHQVGRLGPDHRALHLSLDTAHAFAWFCPEDRGVLSARLAPSEQTPAQWAVRMREHGVTHTVIYDSDRDRLFVALRQFLADPAQWPLLHLEGDVAVFGWRDPTRTGEVDPYRGWEVDLNRLAFDPADEKVAGLDPPTREPRSWRFWEAFWKPAPPRPIDRDEATLHLLHADALRGSAHARHVPAWESTHAAALAGAAGSWTGPGSLLDAQLRLTLLLPPTAERGPGSAGLPPLTRLALASYQRFAYHRDDIPPAILYLAVRAARRALAKNPDDANAYLVLGESYLRLIQSTRERSWARRMPELMQLRCAQASAALNQAIALKPGLAQAHRDLGLLYMELGYLDLTAKHYRSYLERTREAGPPRGVTAEQFREHLARIEAEIAPVAKGEQEQEQAYVAESSGLRVLDRAVLARRRGLAGKALNQLLASDVSAFGPQGMAMELELLTMTGRAQEARQWMAPEQEASLGTRNYYWLRILAASAAGDYAAAAADLAQLAGPKPGGESRDLRDAMALVIGKAVLDDCPGERLSFGTLSRRTSGRIEFSSQVRSLALVLSQRADVAALRGLLALEVGEVGEAEAAFRQALTYWDDDSRSGVDFGGRVIAEDCLSWLESARAATVAAGSMGTPGVQGQ